MDIDRPHWSDLPLQWTLSGQLSGNHEPNGQLSA